MADIDLSEIQSTESTKIVGSDSTGTETYPVNSTTDNKLQTEDVIKGSTDGTRIGNVNDRLKVNNTPSALDKDTFTYGTSAENPIGGVFQDTSPTVSAGQTGGLRMTQYRALHTNLRNNSGTEIGTSTNPIITQSSTSTGRANILMQNEFNVTSKGETDVPGTIYTVASSKTFALSSIELSYDTQSVLFLRFKKQTGGVGSFVTLLRISVAVSGQDTSCKNFTFTVPINVGSAGDVFKLTYDASLAKGTLWAGYSGEEF